jgi:syntaxin 16
LVIEQGTILDRIDYNIEEAKTNVKKGNVELQKTLKRETSFRA